MSLPLETERANDVPPRDDIPPAPGGDVHERVAPAMEAPQANDRDPGGTAVVGDHVDSAAELEVIQAIEANKQTSGRMSPTWSEVLEILQGLGYEKRR